MNQRVGPVQAITVGPTRVVILTPDPGFHYSIAQGRVRRLEQELDALDNAKGGGVLQGTAVGRAATAWTDAKREWARCLDRAEQAGVRERHQLRKQAKGAAEREGPLRDAFARLAAPERARIRAELPEAKKLLDELEGQHFGHLHFRSAHPRPFAATSCSTARSRRPRTTWTSSARASTASLPNGPRCPSRSGAWRASACWTAASGWSCERAVRPSAGGQAQRPGALGECHRGCDECPAASRPSPRATAAPPALTPPVSDG